MNNTEFDSSGHITIISVIQNNVWMGNLELIELKEVSYKELIEHKILLALKLNEVTELLAGEE